MTSERRFEQDLPDLMAQLASPRVPDYRDDVVQLSARTRQRPAWTFPERWLPVDITLAPARGRPRSLLNLAAIAIVGLLILGMLAAYVGSRPTPVPPPFGLAANGALFFDANGEIVAMDTLDSTPRTVVKGAETYTYPLPSRDGRLMMFDHTANGSSKIYVSGIDGSNVHPLPGTYTDWTETDWSPDGQHLAVLTTVAGVPSLTVLASDGSECHDAAARPGRQPFLVPGGRADRLHGRADAVAIRVARTAGRRNVCALYVVDPAGGEARQILSSTRVPGHLRRSPRRMVAASCMSAGRRPTSRAGSTSSTSPPATDRRVPIDGVASATEDTNQVWVAPDGTHILFDWLGETESRWAVAPLAGGPAVQIGPAFSDHPDGMDMEVAFSPDGTSILASYPQPDGSIQYWLLDPTGKTPGRQVTLPGSYVPAWQRKAAG